MTSPYPVPPANGADVTEDDGPQDLEPIGSAEEIDEAANG